MKQDQDIVKKIVKAVMREIDTQENIPSISADNHALHQKELLLLISGGLQGVEDVQNQLKLLYKDRYRIRVLFTGAGRKLLGEAWIQEAIPDACIIDESTTESPDKIIRNADALVIPVMTFNMAAKAVCGIADTHASSVMLFALMHDIPIIAADDACHPSNYRSIDVKTTNRMFYNRLMRNIHELKQYGVQITGACELREHVNRLLMDRTSPINKTPLSLGASLNINQSLPKRVLCKKDIDEFEGEEIVVSKNTLITMAAGDRAQELGISIIKKS